MKFKRKLRKTNKRAKSKKMLKEKFKTNSKARFFEILEIKFRIFKKNKIIKFHEKIRKK